MTEAAPTQRSRGMRDVLPDEMEKLRFVEETFARTCSERGYREIRTPVIEPLHLFTSAGTLSPQALDRVYSFLDWDGWSGERVVLRPDSTIPAARLYAEQLDSGRVAKLYYSQNVFHFTEDGSSREEWQCGVELMGDTGGAGDVELAFLALDVLEPLGLPNVAVRLSHAGLVRAVLAGAGMTPEEQSAAYDRLLDGDLTVVDEVEAQLPALNAGLRLLFEVTGEGSGYLENLRVPLSSLPGAAAAIDKLSFVARALEARGVRPLIEAVLARSFEYYSGVILRIDAEGQRILGGGRYDELIGLVGGKRVPALGFALYLAPTVDLLSSPGHRSAATVIAVSPEDSTPAAVAAAHDVAARLRTAGARVETIVGMHSAPSRRIVCRAGGTFTLESPDGSKTFPGIDDVILALELPS
jgi:histidyl-tRNA synthetase